MQDKQGLLLFNSVLILLFQGLLFASIFLGLSQTIASSILENKELINIVQVYAGILFLVPLSEILFTYLKQREKAKLIVGISLAHSIFYAGIVLSGLIIYDLGVMAMIYGLLLGYVFKVCCVLPVFWKESIHRISFSVLSQPGRSFLSQPCRWSKEKPRPFWQALSCSAKAVPSFFLPRSDSIAALQFLIEM